MVLNIYLQITCISVCAHNTFFFSISDRVLRYIRNLGGILVGLYATSLEDSLRLPWRGCPSASGEVIVQSEMV